MYWGCPGRECAMWVPRRGACLPPALRGSAALGSTWVFPCQVRHQAGLVGLRWELKSERIGDDGLRGGKVDHHLYRSSADRPCGSCSSVALLSWPAGSEQAWIRFISDQEIYQQSSKVSALMLYAQVYAFVYTVKDKI